MVLFYQLAYLRRDGCAIETHHEQLAHGPFYVSAGYSGDDGSSAYRSMSSHTEGFSILESIEISSIMAVESAHPFQ